MCLMKRREMSVMSLNPTMKPVNQTTREKETRRVLCRCVTLQAKPCNAGVSQASASIQDFALRAEEASKTAQNLRGGQD
jgi:hypothetical protein